MLRNQTRDALAVVVLATELEQAARDVFQMPRKMTVPSTRYMALSLTVVALKTGPVVRRR